MSDVKAAKLTMSQVDMELRSVPEWKLNNSGEIERTLTLTGFPQAMLYVNSIALLAESKNHHPDILVQWNKVKLTLSTHDAGGLTAKDFELAKLISAIPHI